MRLKTIWIENYKNLQNTEIEFQYEDSIVAIVGNNGTGKSNLIEALLHIFIGLYYDEPPSFGFRIAYEAHDKHVTIGSVNGNAGLHIDVNGYPLSRRRFKEHVRNAELLPPFPALIFGYYSGTCERVGRQLKRYRRTYSAKLRRQSRDLERRFVFSDIDQADWVLIALFAHQHPELLKDLSIDRVGKLAITLRQPRTYREDVDEPSFWGMEGGFRDFLVGLDAHSSEQESSTRRYTNAAGNQIEERTYVFDADGLVALGRSSSKRRTTVFSMLQALASRDMLVNVECTFMHQDVESEVIFDELSEGEKQLISVLGGLWLANQHECLVLLDEPDTHLNPAWSSQYTELLREALHAEQRVKSTVLVATHDPMLISDLKAEQVLIADNPGGRLTYSYPSEAPQGLGISGILTSDMFGLMTTLDHKTSEIIGRRRAILENPDLSDEDAALLTSLNEQLDQLGYNFVHPDEDYRQFLISRKQALARMEREEVSTVEQRMELINNILADKGYAV